MKKTITPIFCKPDHGRLLYDDGKISFRSLDLALDIPTIHDWVNKDYAKPFWKMEGSIHLYTSCYQCILQNPFAHAFSVFYNCELVAQIDVYRVLNDELHDHVQAGENEMGFHLIRKPYDPINPPPGNMTVDIVRAFLNYFFSFGEATNMWAEPDKNNNKSLRLLAMLGFEYVTSIQMSYKTALVYRLNKSSFLAHSARILDYEKI
jgi:acetyl CoA:N6-hydroxylysine acetyl transferase